MKSFPVSPTGAHMESFGEAFTTLHTPSRHKITEAPYFLPLLPSLAATTDQESP